MKYIIFPNKPLKRHTSPLINPSAEIWLFVSFRFNSIHANILTRDLFTSDWRPFRSGSQIETLIWGAKALVIIQALGDIQAGDASPWRILVVPTAISALAGILFSSNCRGWRFLVSSTWRIPPIGRRLWCGTCRRRSRSRYWWSRSMAGLLADTIGCSFVPERIGKGVLLPVLHISYRLLLVRRQQLLWNLMVWCLDFR